MIIYLVKNTINNKLYVGQTIQTLNKRWKCHQSKGNVLFNSIKKHGKENFTIEQIDFAETMEELNEKEIYWIQQLNTVSPNGYNIRFGGNSGGAHSEETRRKISLAGIGREVSQETRDLKSKQMSGENNPMFGKSPNIGKECKIETRKKISESQIGKKLSKETKIKISQSLKGRKAWREGKQLGHESNRKNQIEFEVFKKTGEFVGKWKNQRICAEELNIPFKGINTVLKGIRPSHKGYIFKRCENARN